MLNFVFLTTSLSATSLIFFKSTGTVFILPTSKSSTFVFKLLKLVGTLVSLLLFSQLQLLAIFLTAKSDVSISVACSNSFLVA